MSESAKVNTIEALQAFREMLATFGEEAKQALGAIEMELRRAQDWLEHDQPLYWRQVVRRCDREMNDARSALHKKDLQRTHGYIPDTSEEKEILRRARQRMYEAEKTLQSIRRWGPQLQNAIAEYHGQSRSLDDMLFIDMERSLAMLDRMISALEGYVSTAPPRASEPPRTPDASTDSDAPPA